MVRKKELKEGKRKKGASHFEMMEKWPPVELVKAWRSSARFGGNLISSSMINVWNLSGIDELRADLKDS